MKLEELRKKALCLPSSPGVYLMHNKEGEIIYVGKARILPNRVSQYFLDMASHSPKVRKMVEHVDDFEVILASSEFDALMLENILIKKHMPRYNIRLKDDKGYPFIRLDLREDFPRFSIVSTRANDGARYFGPYAGRSAAHKVLDAVGSVLMLPECHRVFPRDFGKDRPCLCFQTKRCIGLCRGEISKGEFHSILENAILLLSGQYHLLVDQLTNEMEKASEELAFEKAALLRDRLFAVRRLCQKQIIISDTITDADVAAVACDERGHAAVLLSLREGSIISRFSVTGKEAISDKEELLTDFLLQYYSEAQDIPSLLLLPEEGPDIPLLEKLLSETRKKRVHIHIPQRGEKHSILEMAVSNAEEELRRSTTQEEHITRTAEALRELLSLPHAPVRLEGFDISNTGNAYIVSSMAVFENGKPKKSDYRRFRMKEVEEQNDFASMQETITRRFQALLEGKPGFQPAPDLLLIDGGIGQVNAAREALEALGLDIPLAGMQKDDHHHTASLILPDGREIWLNNYPSVFRLIGNLQEEAHRFAIGYHRSLRDKKPLSTSLLEIPGVGKVRAEALIRHFRSVAGVKNAGLPELNEIVGGKAARSVYEYFHKEPTV